MLTPWLYLSVSMMWKETFGSPPVPMYSTSVTPFPKDAVQGKVKIHIIVIYLWFGFVLLLMTWTCTRIIKNYIILYHNSLYRESYNEWKGVYELCGDILLPITTHHEYWDHWKLHNCMSQDHQKLHNCVSQDHRKLHNFMSQLATNTEIIENCTIVCHKITENCAIFGDLSVFLLRHMITEINLILYLGISTAAFTTVDYKASRGIKVYQKAYVSVISSLVVLVAIFDFNL